MKKVIRGAIQVNDNSEQEITFSVQRLFKEIIKRNNLKTEDINFVILSQTKDLTAFNAATAIRKLQVTENDKFPLFCCQEADVINSLEKTVRILVSTDIAIDSRDKVNHVYLDGAAKLRPDLAN